MALTGTTSNHFKYQLASKEIDLENDDLKVIFMNDTFTFNKDNHATLGDVTGSQLASEYGYTQNDLILSGCVLTEDDANDRAILEASDLSLTASGGNIGPSNGVVFFDDTVSDNTIIGAAEFASAYTITDGLTFILKDISIVVS